MLEVDEVADAAERRRSEGGRVDVVLHVHRAARSGSRASSRSASRSPSRPRLTACCTSPPTWSTSPGMPTPTDGRHPVAGRGPPTTRAAVSMTPSDPGSVGLAGLGQHPAVGVDEDAEGLGRPDVEADQARPSCPFAVIGPTLPLAARRATASRPGRDHPRAQILGTVGRRSGPASPTRRRPRRRGPRAGPAPRRRAAAGARRAPGRRAARRAASSYDASTGRPQGTSPTAIVPGESMRTTCAPRRSGRLPSTRDGPRRALGQQTGSSTGRGDGRRRRQRRRSARTASARRASDSRPSRTAATTAAWTARTSATSSASVPCSARGRAGRSPATSASDRGLRDPPAGRRAGHVEGVADDDAGEAELVAQHARATAWLSVAGRSGSSAGTTTCEVITAAAPAFDRGRERHQLALGEDVGGHVETGAARGGCPGRCRRARASASRRPRRRPPGAPRSTRRRGVATSAGSAPKLRVPMTGLSGSAVDVRDRREVIVIPSAASSDPTCRPTARVRSGRSAVPERERAEHRAAVLGVQPGDVAALLVDRHDARGASGVSGRPPRPVRRPCWRRRGTPRRDRRRAGGAGRRPARCPRTRAAARRAPAGQLVSGVAHPFTAPAVRPAHHPALDDEEEDHDRDRRSASSRP